MSCDYEIFNESLEFSGTDEKTSNFSKNTNHFNNRFSISQLGLMVDYMTLNPNLVLGKITFNFSKKDKQKQWDELAQLLNSDPFGVKKEASRWRKSWNDLKTALRLKAKKIKAHRYGVGEGPSPDNLDELEIRILNMIGCSLGDTDNSDSGSIGIDEISDNSNDSFATVEQDLQKTIDSAQTTLPCSRITSLYSCKNNFDEANSETNYTIGESSHGPAQKKKLKVMHHPYFEEHKEATLIRMLKRQNQLLNRIAGSVEGIEKSVAVFAESSKTMKYKNSLLENIAVNMERVAETFVRVTVALKKIAKK